MILAYVLISLRLCVCGCVMFCFICRLQVKAEWKNFINLRLAKVKSERKLCFFCANRFKIFTFFYCRCCYCSLCAFLLIELFKLVAVVVIFLFFLLPTRPVKWHELSQILCCVAVNLGQFSASLRILIVSFRVASRQGALNAQIP